MELGGQSSLSFGEADRRYAELKRRYHAGEIDEEQFDARLQDLMIQDQDGRWWAKSRGDDSSWMYHDGDAWTPGTPPDYEVAPHEDPIYVTPERPDPDPTWVYPPPGVPNTSGMGERAVVPPEANRWNWGAFLFNWLWGLFNLRAGKAVLGLVLALVLGLFTAGLASLAWAVVLGVKGGEWAWREKRWENIAHFQRTQRRWAWAGVIVLVASIVLSILLVVLLGLLQALTGSGGSAGAPAEANVVFEDDFSDSSSGWPGSDGGEGFAAGYGEGGYRIDNPPPPGSAAALINAGAGGDARVDAVAASITRVPNDDSSWGVVCRASDTNNYYGLGVYPDGYSRIFKVEDGQATNLAVGNSNGAMQEGVEGNGIRGDCVGSTLTLYVNGQQVLEAEDAEFGSGQVGLFVDNAASEPPGTEVLFDDFVVSEP